MQTGGQSGTDIPKEPEEIGPSYSSVWSAEPGIDLFSRGSELVRAAMEAGNQTALYSPGEAFPGYIAALPPVTIDYSANIAYPVRYGAGGEQASAATYYFHIAELSETPTDVTAEVCTETQLADTVEHDGPWRHGFSWLVTLHNTVASPGTPGIVDTDADTENAHTNRRPDWNVFDTWRIETLRTGGRTERATAAHPLCTEWWQARHPVDTTVTPSGYTVSPAGAVPGKPVAVQYPEWIGPGHPE